MANAKIILIGPGDLGIVAELYNQIFAPPEKEDYFRRRFHGRNNVSLLLALLDERPVGFSIGFELMPSTYFMWLSGVIPDARGMGIAVQLLNALSAWAQDHHYDVMRFECLNQHRPMLHVAISEGFDLVGIRWDSDASQNFVIFEKDLR